MLRKKSKSGQEQETLRLANKTICNSGVERPQGAGIHPFCRASDKQSKHICFICVPVHKRSLFPCVCNDFLGFLLSYNFSMVHVLSFYLLYVLVLNVSTLYMKYFHASILGTMLRKNSNIDQ